ncbi:MAG: glutamate-5-semialdehyde dehydrogenase [Desulfonatronovibrionaceae bacterium]
MSKNIRIKELAEKADQAGRILSRAGDGQKRDFLTRLANILRSEQDRIAQANARDLDQARAAGLDSARTGRLLLTPEGIEEMAVACEEVAALKDPVGEIEKMNRLPNGLQVGRMRIPLGVVAIIYESRPNVTIDAAILCLKAGNAVVLRGGSEAFNSNECLAGILARALEESGLPREAAVFVPTTDRAAVSEMLKLDQHIDVVIPRGGEGLIRAVVEQATMPVLKHYKGVCHIYVHRDADQDTALEIVRNAKVQKPGVCNALECLLVHSEAAGEFLPRLKVYLAKDEVRFRACPRSVSLLGENAVPAEDSDWGREFLSLDMAVRVVDSQQEAVEHIEIYGSNHSEAIITASYSRAMRFVQEVDASAVLVNASTRFNDGGQFGLGAEIGISTSKIHAYGPMGVQELTGSKFVVFGQGQIRG